MSTGPATSGRFPEYRPHGRVSSPLLVPINQRVETLAALIHCSSMLLLPCLYFFLWTREIFWPFLIIYSIYSYILDDTQSSGNSIYRTSNWLRNRFIFKKFVDYFPVLTHRTVPLPPTTIEESRKTIDYPSWVLCLPSKVVSFLRMFHVISKQERFINKERKIGPRYLFAVHPHGVISFGITATLCWGGYDKIWDTVIPEYTAACDTITCAATKPNLESSPSHVLKTSKSFRSLFPGIKAHLLTLPTQFLLPFYRDYIMALGVGLVTKSGITSILKRNHSVAIVVGGAHESLLARPGMNRLVLNRRKGFIKLALETCTKTEKDLQKLPPEDLHHNIEKGIWNETMSDIAIVPVYVYGENNIHNVYNTTEDSDSDKSKTLKTFLKLQLLLKTYVGFTLPLVNSRSIFNYDFGLLPYKRRMDVVTGEPIYIYRKFNRSVGDPVTEDEINHYHEIYKTKLFELWEKNKYFATKWDEKLSIVE